jgi:hypothetical protein
MKKAITHCLIKFGIDHLVYFSRIGVVGCGGLSDCEELVGVTHRRLRAFKYCVGSAKPTKKPTILGDRVWLC